MRAKIPHLHSENYRTLRDSHSTQWKLPIHTLWDSPSTQWQLPIHREILPLRSESYQYLERFSLYAVKATGTLRDSPSPQWKLPVPYLESHEKRFTLNTLKATGTLRAMRRDSSKTQGKLPVPWGLRSMRRDSPSTPWKLLVLVPWEPWGEIRPQRSESFWYLESHKERFAVYAVKATGTLRAIRRDSPSTQWKDRLTQPG